MFNPRERTATRPQIAWEMDNAKILIYSSNSMELPLNRILCSRRY